MGETITILSTMVFLYRQEACLKVHKQNWDLLDKKQFHCILTYQNTSVSLSNLCHLLSPCNIPKAFTFPCNYQALFSPFVLQNLHFLILQHHWNDLWLLFTYFPEPEQLKWVITDGKSGLITSRHCKNNWLSCVRNIPSGWKSCSGTSSVKFLKSSRILFYICPWPVGHLFGRLYRTFSSPTLLCCNICAAEDVVWSCYWVAFQGSGQQP